MQKKWAEASPILEELRVLRLHELDDETARRMILDLFSMWRAREFHDLGAGVIEQQRILSKLRRRESGRDCRRLNRCRL